MSKGSSFERDICRQLGLWWTDGKRDDVFWRTSGSGARASVRSKKDKATFGQYGDVQATDPVGQPLIDVCTIELKRGYSGSTFADLVDKPDKAAAQQYEKFIEQAKTGCEKAGTQGWLLIIKRDRRKPIVIMSFHFITLLASVGSNVDIERPSFLIVYNCCEIFGTILDRFFAFVKPEHIKKIGEGL